MTLAQTLLSGSFLLFAGLGCIGEATGADTPFPEPEVGSSGGGVEKAVLAGGCFWGVDAVFKHVRGVSKVLSGYAGGSSDTASYEIVSSGRTGHAEAVEITFDSRLVSFGTLLRIFFSVAHDPTEVNRQGPDVGTQYRSAIFYATKDQEKVARSYIDQLSRSGLFSRPIATQVVPLAAFYPAEDYHQNFLEENPTYPYIVYHDLPKLAALKKLYPELWQP